MSGKTDNIYSEDLKEKIAIVTGAGSGLGRSVAIGCARAGAKIAVVDINGGDANQTCKIIKNEMPDIVTSNNLCDVTNESNVEEVLEIVQAKFGKVDILANCAGIAPAGPLIDLSVEAWRRTLEVNLTGYFLMAKHSARLMISKGIGGSIINLSSKSGLDASKDNTPYNATKAGEVHMARGWAKELGQYNIRVNSICPGNVFEGSKIWNPEYIEACAKKYSIKPEEVIPHYVSKQLLNQEIKGQDIADAVVFLSSDKARMITGQTLVVDAGQVMVR
jgi:sorbitol-6-phosphate 2-dehydrogenase